MNNYKIPLPSRRFLARCAFVPLLLAVPLSWLRAEEVVAPGSATAAPVSVWDTIEARAAAFTGTGWSMDKAAVAVRPTMKEYFARYAGWTDPTPPPLPEGKLRNLADTPANPRFPLTEKMWTETPGSASVCLWEDDKLAAFSFSIDDNCATDVPFWLELSKKYGGLNITWNLITGFVGGDIPRFLIQGGTWDLWAKVRAEGHHIASHSIQHVTDPVREDGWPGPGWECAESKRQLDAGLVGQKTKLFAYPGSPMKEFSVSYAWRPDVTKYFAAARGGSGNPINIANQIDYFNIRTTAHPDGITEGKPVAEFNLSNTIVKSSNQGYHKFYRGWSTLFIHSVNGGKDWDTNPFQQSFTKVFDWVAAHRDDLWVGHLDDVALYGQERDTATLETVSTEDNRIVVRLSSQMDPAVFDYPLSIKVRLPDAWKGLDAKQGGASVESKFLLHEGAPYGLVKVVPDRGEIVLVPSGS